MATCKECEHLDLKNYNSITGKYFCTYYRRYELASSGSCRSYSKRIDVRESDGCFLTTLATANVNIAENGIYLETLRGFRNNVMHGDEKYADILKEYDVLGPMICDRINEDPEKYDICETMVEKFIKPVCYEIVSGNNDVAVLMYQSMVRNLQEKYEIIVNLDDYEYAPGVKELEKGHGRTRIIKN